LPDFAKMNQLYLKNCLGSKMMSSSRTSWGLTKEMMFCLLIKMMVVRLASIKHTARMMMVMTTLK
jgi:hypothetical protein